jgi:hypothetical protein
LYRIATFAAAPTYRCAVLVRIRCCGRRSRDSGSAVGRRVVAGQKRGRDSRIPDDDEDDIGFWQMVLTEEYGVVRDNAATTSTRSCRRLRRSMRQRVIEAHASVLQNTEFAFFHLTELTSRGNINPNNNNKKNQKGVLSKSKLVAIIDEFGPILRLSGALRSGGVFLVEVCRAKGVRENAILKCVEYLVLDQNRCNPNDMSNESPRSRQTALVVAAARGLSTIVSFLVSVGADPSILCAGRFRLAYATTATVSGVDWTAQQFATAMRTAELAHGTPAKQLKGLDRCIELLAKEVGSIDGGKCGGGGSSRAET